MALPSNISFGTVVGRFVRAVADGVDPDSDPDLIPIEDLRLQFEPSVRVFKNLEAGPPATIFHESIIATTNADGFVIGPDGNPGIRLTATDDPDLIPTGWTWRVAITGPSITGLSFSFTLPSDGTVDLTTLVPVTPNPGSAPPAVMSVAGLHGDVLAPALADLLDPYITGGGGGGAVDSVNGQTGVVVLDAADVGALADDYTPPAPAWGDVTGKPTTFAPAAHTHTIANVTDLQATLDDKVDSDDPRVPIIMTQAAYDGITPVAGQVYIIQG